jgi:outer membrane protein insertion porin family
MRFGVWQVLFRPTTVAVIMCVIVVCVPLTAGASDFGIELPTVKKIEILGNRSIDDKALKARMRTKEPRFYHIFNKPKFRQDMLRRDVEAIKSYYRLNGFFEIEASIETVEKDEQSNSVRIRILINEGPQTLVKNLSFAGQDLIPEKELQKGLKLLVGNPYTPHLLEVDRFAIFNKFFERGYLGASVAYDLNVDSVEVSLSWTITPGEPVRIDNVTLVGNETVDERLIQRELTFEHGQYFNLKDILESKQNLYDTGYFTAVEIEPMDLDMEQRIVDLQLQVRERKMGYWETGIGFGNIYGNRVFLEWGKRNLFGRGYILNLRSSASFRLFEEGEYSLYTMKPDLKYWRNQGSLHFPRILKTKNMFSLVVFSEQDETVEPADVRSLSFSAALTRRITRQTSLLFQYSLKRVQRFEFDVERSRSRNRIFNFLYTRDKRDFYFNPQQGSYISANAAYSGGILGGDDHYYALGGSYQSYRRLTRKTVFAWRFMTGYADPFDETEETGLPIEARYFAGGGNSVRGFRENSLGPRDEFGVAVGGSVLMLTNFELRFPIPLLERYNFSGVVFIDGGNVWKNLDDITIERFKPASGGQTANVLDYMYGFGFGVRYNTPVGPIRLDVGYPITKTTYVEDNYLVYISLGQIF